MTTEEDYQKLEELRYSLQDATWVPIPSACTDAHEFQREISRIYNRLCGRIASHDGLDLTTCKCGSASALVRRTLTGSWYWLCPNCRRYVIGKTHEEASQKAIDYYNGDGPASVLTEDPFIEPEGP